MALVVSPTPSFCCLPKQRVQVARHNNSTRPKADQYASMQLFEYQEPFAGNGVPYWEQPPLVTDFCFPLVDFGPAFSLSLNQEALQRNCHDTVLLQQTRPIHTQRGRPRKRQEPASSVKSVTKVKRENTARHNHTTNYLTVNSPAQKPRSKSPPTKEVEAQSSQKRTESAASNDEVIRLSSFEDILFSSTDSAFFGTSYGTTDLCGLCHQPFETADQDSLRKHLEVHADQFCGEVVCQVCELGFTHRRDLEWHQLYARQGHCGFNFQHRQPCSGHHSFDGNSDQHRFGFALALRQWEQAQLKAYKRGVDAHLNRLSSQSRPNRSSSVPPRPRKDFKTMLSDPSTSSEKICPGKSSPSVASEIESTSESRSSTSGGPDFSNPRNDRINNSEHSANLPIGLKGAVMDLQSRVHDIILQLQPSANTTPKSQILEDEGHLDFESGNGDSPTNVQQLSLEYDISPGPSPGRARSEPPPRTEVFGKFSFTQNSPGSANPGSYGRPGTGGPQASLSNNRGQKRSNENGQSGRDPDDRDNDDGNAGCKRLKPSSAGNGDEEKKFPCVCHIGEPERFGDDTMRHKHISNLCRHLKRHNFYACSTCILQFANDEELNTHLATHIKSCRIKGCRRQRWAFEPEPAQCEHITSSEEQWRKLFTLRYGRAPPADVFDAGHDLSTPMSRIDSGSGSTETIFGQSEFAAPGDSMDLFPSGWQNSLGLPDSDGLEANVPSLDWDSWLLPDTTISSDLPVQNVPKANALAAPQPSASETTKASAEDVSLQRTVRILQGQVASLEKVLNARGLQNMDRIFTLQSQVAQLEQQLFQSSTRERQLEATLGVVFDAYQATGAEKAQPSQPIWNLVMSHSSKGASGTGRTQNNDTPGTAILPETPLPAPSIETAQLLQTVGKGKQSVLASDSAYGSFDIDMAAGKRCIN